LKLSELSAENQWGKKNNLNPNGNRIILPYPFGRKLLKINRKKIKTHLSILTFSFFTKE